MKKKYILIVLVLLLALVLIHEAISQGNETVYYCTIQQTVNGTDCIPLGNDTGKNNISNTIANNYVSAINDLDTIQSANPSFNSTGFNQVVSAVKREAQIEEWILKFLKTIYQLIT